MEGLAELAFRRHHAQIYRYLRRRTGDPYRAEDLAQEVFADAAVALSRGERPSSMLAWLYTIAQRRFADEARRRSRSPAGVRLDDVYFAGYPHWVDPRNVGFDLHAPDWAATHALDVGEALPAVGARRLAVVVHPEDEARARDAAARYGRFERIRVAGQHPGRDFLLYLVPGRG